MVTERCRGGLAISGVIGHMTVRAFVSNWAITLFSTKGLLYMRILLKFNWTAVIFAAISVLLTRDIMFKVNKLFKVVTKNMKQTMWYLLLGLDFKRLDV